MIIDRLSRFSSAQTVTTGSDTGVASTDGIDLKVAIRNIGVGTPLYVCSVITTAMTDSGSNSALAVALQHDSDSEFGSATTLATLYTFPALSAIGTFLYAALPPGLAERYIQLLYTSTNGALSACGITSFLTPTPQAWQAYAKASHAEVNP